MLLKDTPIQYKLMRIILLTSGAVLILTCASYFVYEFLTFRKTTVRELNILGKIIAANSTAALAFDSREDANEILSALKAEPHIVGACLYNSKGEIFSYYPESHKPDVFPAVVMEEQFNFVNSHLEGFQPVVQGDNRLGTLYLKSDMEAMYERFRLYGSIALLVIIGSLLLAYLLSKSLQQGITKPILALANTARAVSEHQDYSVRATKVGKDEVGLLTDAFNQMLTEIEHQNREIQLFNQRLEQNIIDRTKELEVANKELEAFSYSVSHDLRAPLRSIDGYSRVLIEDYGDKLDEGAKRNLSIIMKNAIKMGRLIDDLLEFSRLGKQNITKVNLDMNSIVHTVVEELKTHQKKEVKIEVKPQLPVFGDSSMLKQVLTNLVSNAIKYSMKKEKPIVELGSYKENGFNIYYVKDNGAGFDMLYYDKLFGVFQRLHNSNEFEGTGVGLALVQRIVSKHGGKVWAEAKVDEGATFYFSLPSN